jgi:hypothetical protein
MSAPGFDPYAPPKAPADLPAFVDGPLPPGVRRFRLDPELYRSAIRRRAVRVLAVMLPAMALYWVPTAMHSPETSWTLVPGALFAVVWVGVMVLNAGRPNSPALVSYELLVSARVLRRTVAAALPVEVLRPEVTSIVETSDGLYVCCEKVRRSIVIGRTLSGYEDVRNALREWGSIESLRGWKAWRRATLESRRQGTRDAVAGSALDTDRSLASELETIRSVSSATWRSFPAAPSSFGSKPSRVLILWVLLIVMFLAIWQFLQPANR